MIYKLRGGGQLAILQDGTSFKIRSYKHDGTLHREWQENIALHQTDQTLIGMNNRTKMIEANGETFTTKEPALFYFHKHHWFNVIRILHKESPYFYCNISSPFTYRNKVLTYIDYDIDIIVSDDFSYEILDHDEYEINKKQMNYGKDIEYEVNESIITLKKWIRQRKGPFHQRFIEDWWHYAKQNYM